MKTDNQIRQDIQNELLREPYLPITEISVAVKDGFVVFSGTVRAYAKNAAEQAKANWKIIFSCSFYYDEKTTPFNLSMI